MVYRFVYLLQSLLKLGNINEEQMLKNAGLCVELYFYFICFLLI